MEKRPRPDMDQVREAMREHDEHEDEDREKAPPPEPAEDGADDSGPPEGARVVGVADAGGWSERVPVPSHRVAALPDDVDFADAAALPVAGLTALRALREAG